MTDKELRHMNRKELLELLIEQMQENQMLQKELDSVKEELNHRRIKLENAGSIAEAALALHQIFEQADAAAKEYLENVRFMADARAGSDNFEEKHN